MEEIVTTFIQKHQLLSKNSTVLIGVSGGPDSMALLHYMYSKKKAWNLDLYVLSVDHQLRDEGGVLDLKYVKEQCEEWEIPFKGTSVDVPKLKRHKNLGTQEAARILRYQFFEQQMHKLKGDYLVLGHHGDDQVETLLMRFTRTASSISFKGIPVERTFAAGKIIRPLLCVTKQQIENYCEQHEIHPRIDPSNLETNYTRNYYRKFVLPLLKEKNGQLHKNVQHLSETLSEDEEYLQKQAEDVVRKEVTFNKKDNTAWLEIPSFLSNARALQRRSYHLILNYLYKELPKNLSYVHEEQFFSLLNENRGSKVLDFPRQLEIEKSYQKVIFRFKTDSSSSKSFHEILEIPGEHLLPDGSKIITKYDKGDTEQGKYTYTLDVNQVALPLHVRSRRPGDRMSWKGLNGTRKIKDIFIDEKIPVKERDTWPIITDNNGKILWFIGLKKGHTITSNNNSLFIQLYFQKGDM